MGFLFFLRIASSFLLPPSSPPPSPPLPLPPPSSRTLYSHENSPISVLSVASPLLPLLLLLRLLFLPHELCFHNENFPTLVFSTHSCCHNDEKSLVFSPHPLCGVLVPHILCVGFLFFFVIRQSPSSFLLLVSSSRIQVKT